jgi:hypothetical protein
MLGEWRTTRPRPETYASVTRSYCAAATGTLPAIATVIKYSQSMLYFRDKLLQATAFVDRLTDKIALNH